MRSCPLVVHECDTVIGADFNPETATGLDQSVVDGTLERSGIHSDLGLGKYGQLATSFCKVTAYFPVRRAHEMLQSRFVGDPDRHG
jgi:hypothetical protein